MNIIKRYPTETALRKEARKKHVVKSQRDTVDKACKQCGFRLFQEVSSCPSCSFDNGDGSGLTTDYDGKYIGRDNNLFRRR
mgnify:CR=1 FL=1